MTVEYKNIVAMANGLEMLPYPEEVREVAAVEGWYITEWIEDENGNVLDCGRRLDASAMNDTLRRMGYTCNVSVVHGVIIVEGAQ